MMRMTSFGVRQWLRAMEELPKSITDLYLLGCPTFFVDQLNMVLNFGGQAKVLTALAPYVCPACGIESGELIDVLAQRATLAKEPPVKNCARCNAKLEFDETPESYFAFATKYGATSIHPAAQQLLAERRLFASADNAIEKPPRIIKLIHGSVTYFRIIGSIGSMFRARPFLVGVEGEIVIDLAEVDRFDPSGQKEWRRLIKTLSSQVVSTTLVDVPSSFLASAGDTLTFARNVVVASLLAPYECVECGRVSQVSESLAHIIWPAHFEDRVCPTCGGTTRNKLVPELLVPLQKASTLMPHATTKVVENRAELVSRALTDASVAKASTAAPLTAADLVLGKYQIVRPLSAGGMADVYLAKQVGIGGFEKPVAIKRIQNKLLESRQQAIELFLNEAKIAGRLTHPNIVQVIDIGEQNGALYLAMEYVHGKDLRDLVKTLQKESRVMPLAEACYIVKEVAQALDYAYWSTDHDGKRLSVVHRDVSPHNVILGFDGTVKLLDFGVAMSAITEHEQSLLVGKWTYMSPETTMNGRTDHRSDLFSLGVIFYHLCSGFMPFSGPEPKEIIRKIRAGEYTRLEELAPQIPPRLTTLVGRLLAPNPEFRPQRGQEVVDELTSAAREYGLESSPQRVADYVASVFSNPAERPSVKQIVRVYPDSEADSHSLTPSSRTFRGPSSQSFRKVVDPGSISLSQRLPLARQRLPEPTTTSGGNLINLMIAFAIVGVVVLVAYLIVTNI